MLSHIITVEFFPTPQLLPYLIKVILYNIHFAYLIAFIWRKQCFKLSVKVSVTFTMWLMSNHTPKMTQVSIEISGNLHFFQIWHGETF